MGNSTSNNNNGTDGWASFNCFTDDGEDSSITDNSIAEINNEEMVQHIIWEFQRYHPATGWGAGKNLLPTDPGRYASHKRDVYASSLQELAPPIPGGYRVDLGWAIVVQKRKYKPNATVEEVAKSSITDCFGWHYANSFDARSWSDEHNAGCNVRRRAWRRILIPVDSS